MNYDGGGGGGGIKIQLMHPITEEVQRYANIWRFADLTKALQETLLNGVVCSRSFRPMKHNPVHFSHILV